MLIINKIFGEKMRYYRIYFDDDDGGDVPGGIPNGPDPLPW